MPFHSINFSQFVLLNIKEHWWGGIITRDVTLQTHFKEKQKYVSFTEMLLDCMSHLLFIKILEICKIHSTIINDQTK
jgi:hypothetical protein